MFTWLLASKGTRPLAVAYFTVAAVALLVAVSTFLVATGNHSAGSTTLQLNITHHA